VLVDVTRDVEVLAKAYSKRTRRRRRRRRRRKSLDKC
jgi:hypothetical protein